jgi:hypothetical protein
MTARLASAILLYTFYNSKSKLNHFKTHIILLLQIQSLHLPRYKQTIDLGASDAVSSFIYGFTF